MGVVWASTACHPSPHYPLAKPHNARDAHRSSPVAGRHEADEPSSTRLRHAGHRSDSARFAQIADRFALIVLFSGLFTEMVCTLGTTPPRVAIPPAPGGGIALHEGPTRRRHAASQLLVPQNPHTRRHGGQASRQHRAHCRLVRQNSPSTGLQRPLREKTPPASPKTPKLGCFQRAGRTISRRHDNHSAAGRTFSRTGRSNMAALKPTTPLQPLTRASMKPPSPLRAPQQQPLKPVAPLQPKNAPNTPIVHPQRRPRFQLRLGIREQRRRRFQPHAGTSEQRRRRFQPGNALHRIGKQCTSSHTITRANR